MSIEPHPNATLSASAAASAIENEIPAYRAISPGAVVALLLGVLSILCFVSWYFLAFAAAAVLIGLVSDRKIQQRADVLTGRGMAQTGVTLGLIFGLTSLSVAGVSHVIRSNQARQVAGKYEDLLKNRTFEEAVWYAQHPERRKDYTPVKLVEEMSRSAGAPQFEESNGALRRLKKALAEPHAEIHFDHIERQGVEEVVPFAAAVYRVHNPEAQDPAERDRAAMAVLRWSPSRRRRNDWWASEIQFPYKENSYSGPTPQPRDDGHGHAH